jgi:hypothetical protein
MTTPEGSPRLPDPERSRAVIIGSATYDDPAIPDLLSAGRSAQALHNVLTDPARGGLRASHCRLITNPRNSVEVIEAIAQAAAEAEDLLLVYFAGHGLPDRNGAAHLAVRESRKSLAQLSAVPFSAIREAFASRAATKVLIVDSCFSAQAIKEMMSGDPLTEALATFDGVFVAASADRYKTASAPASERYTTFTGTVLDVIQTGIAGHGEVLTLIDVFDTVHDRLVAAGRPEPQFASRDRAGRLGLVRNAGVGEAVRPAPPVARPERVVFPSAYTRLNKALTWLSSLIAVAAAIPTLSSPQPDTSVLVVGALAMVIAFSIVTNPFTANYQLEADGRGLTLRARNRIYAIGWINVAHATLTRRRGRNYELRVRLLPGAALRPAPWWLPGPRRGDGPNDYMVMLTRQVDATPVTIDDTLRWFGGVSWRRSPEIDEMRAAELRTPTVFRTRRGLYAALGVTLVAVGLALLTSAATTPFALTAVVSGLAAVTVTAPGLFLLLCFLCPTELSLSTEGMRLTRFGRHVEVTWDEVDKIGLGRSLRLPYVPRQLHLRLVDRGDVTLVDVLSLSVRRTRLATALAEYADSRWDESFRPDDGVRASADAARFSGRVAGWASLIAPIVTVTALLFAASALGAPPDRSVAGPPVFFGTDLILIAALAGSGLLARRRLTMTVTTDGVDLRLGHRRVGARWDDVRYVQLVTVETDSPGRKSRRHTEIRIAPNRDDALKRTWRMPLFCARVHDVYRLCAVDTLLCHLDVSIDTLDRELRKHAGSERWRPRAEEQMRRDAIPATK